MKKVRITLEYTTTVEVVQEVPDDTNYLDLETHIHEKGFDWETIDKRGETNSNVMVEEVDETVEETDLTWEDFVE